MIEKKDKRARLTIIGVLAFQILVFVAATIITTPFYETEDDNTMAGISLGLYGKREFHLVYMSTILGKLINTLSSVWNVVNWYTMLHYITVFCSFAIILFVLLEGASVYRSLFICMLIGITFNFQFFHSLQFTKTAGVATLAGIVLLVKLIEGQNRNRVLYIAGAFLLVLGSMFRFESYGMVLCTCFLWVLNIFLRHIRNKRFQTVGKYLIWFGVPILLSLILYVTDFSVYQTKEWKEYRIYNDLRSELLDFGFPKGEESEALYATLPLKEVDYINYSTWDIADPERLTTDIMQKLVDGKDEQRYITNIKEFAGGGFLVLFDMPFMALVAVGGIAFLCYKKRNMLSLGAIVAGVLAIGSFFVIIGRFKLAYTNAILALTVIVLMCYTSREHEFVTNKKWLKVILLMLGCVASLFVAYKWFMQGINVKYEQNQNPDRDEVTSLIYADKENFYFTKVGYGIETFSDIWKPVEEGEGENSATLGDWLMMSPIVFEQWGEYDISNPYRALAERDDVYLIDGRTSYWKHQYIISNYNSNAKMIALRNIGGYRIWEFVDEDIVLDAEACRTDNVAIDYYGYFLEIDETGYFVRGHLFEHNTNSFDQRVYLGVVKNGEETERFYSTEQTRNENSSDLYNGKYSGFSFWNEGMIDFENDEVYLYLENENGLYRMRFSESK